MRAEIVREQKRAVEKSVRELEREKAGMDKTEAQLIADIKKAAKAYKKIKLQCDYYNPAIHAATFALPNWIAKLVP